jgi:hypothetical protein
LKEKAPVQTKKEVIVTFLTEDKPLLAKRIPGAFKGKISIPDNFNDF